MTRSRRASLLAVALMVGVLLAASGAAVGQQGQTAPGDPQGPPDKLGFGFEPNEKPGEDFLAAELIVGLKEGVTQSTAGLERAAQASGGRVKGKLDDPLNSVILVKFPSEAAAKAAVDTFTRRPDVEFVERNGFVEGQSVSSDPKVGYEWQHTVIRKTANTTPATKVINVSARIARLEAIANEVAAIKDAGKILFASAGNGNSSTDPDGWHPASDPNAIGVMATEENDCRWYHSNFSPTSNPTQYDIAAPGFNLGTITPNNGYEPPSESNSGTSWSTPIVSGAAALVWGQNPTLTKDQLINRLLTTSEKSSCGFPVATPRLDIRKAVLNTSETAVIGRTLDPATGFAPAPETTPVTAKLYSGSTLLKSDATNRIGFYEMTGLAAGTGRQLKDTRSGYVSATLRNSISIGSGQVAGPFTDALPKARRTGNATVTIDWKTHQPVIDTPGCVDRCNGWEFDVAVKLPNGTYVNALENNGSLTAAPFVEAPRDSLEESLLLQPVESAVIGSQAVNGVYKIVVSKGNGLDTQFNPSWSGSQASVQMYNGAASIGGGHKAAPSTCGTNQFWYVGDLTKSGTSYTWTNKNLCTNTAP